MVIELNTICAAVGRGIDYAERRHANLECGTGHNPNGCEAGWQRTGAMTIVGGCPGTWISQESAIGVQPARNSAVRAVKLCGDLVAIRVFDLIRVTRG